MSEAFIKKNVKLSLEFDSYLANHPALFKAIPNGAYIVITTNGDKQFNADSVSIIKNIKNKKIIEAHKSSNRWSLRPMQLRAV
jgi:5,10-methenyltetrahydromethanopterin hydrogenase